MNCHVKKDTTLIDKTLALTLHLDQERKSEVYALWLLLIWPRIVSRSWPEEGRLPIREAGYSEGRLVVIDELVGESELMREVRKNIAIAVALDLSVLIIGEPGHLQRTCRASHTHGKQPGRETFRRRQLRGN